MPELDEQLRGLLGDEQTLRQLLELTGGANDAPAPKNEPTQALPAQAINAAQLISTMLAQPREREPEPAAHEPAAHMSQAEPEKSHEPAGMADVLPQLLLAISGDSCALPPEKLNLVRALRPYAASHCESIDRAIKMAGIAKAAKNALGALGRR